MARYTLPELLARIEEHGGPQGLDLRGADLRGLDAGPQVLQAELARADADRPAWLAETEGLNLAGANLQGADLRAAHLAAADLTRANLQDARLRQVNLAQARLDEARLQDTDLRSACLTGASLRAAKLEDAHLRRADLLGARLEEANLEDADLCLANLSGADLRGANLEDAALRQANLGGANLHGANLKDADLRGANLEGADLTGANLDGARLDDGTGRKRRGHTDQWAQGLAAQVHGEVMAGLGEGLAGLNEALKGLGEGLASIGQVEGSAGEGSPYALNIPLEGATTLKLRLGLGTVRLEGATRDDVLLECPPAAADDLEIVRAEGAIVIKQKEYEYGGRWLGGRKRRLDLRLALPPALAHLEVRTGLGDIHGRQIAATVRLVTGKGDVTVQEGRLEGRVRTGLGDVTLHTVCGETVLHTGNGDVVVQQAEQARLSISTGRGNIRLGGGLLERLKARTGMGAIEGACALAPGTHCLHTGSGVISLELPAGQAAQVEASTGMGRVRSDWPLVRVGRPGPAAVGSMRMVGSFGGEDGRAVISLKTGMGNIHLKRQQGPGEAVAAAAADPAHEPTLEARMAILESLSRGEITVEEAEELINQLSR